MVFVVLLLLPTQAWAWTETHLKSASMESVLAENGHATVTMRVAIQVTHGTMHHFEAAGLPEDAELDTTIKPPVAVDETGRKWPLSGTLHAGQAAFDVPSPGPSRGSVELVFRYSTHWRGAVVTWSMPGWIQDLQDAHIAVLAPSGTTLDRGGAFDEGLGTSARTIHTNVGEVLELSRERVSRFMPLSLTMRMPAPVASPLDAIQKFPLGTAVLAMCLALALGAMCVAKRRSWRRYFLDDPEAVKWIAPLTDRLYDSVAALLTALAALLMLHVPLAAAAVVFVLALLSSPKGYIAHFANEANSLPLRLRIFDLTTLPGLALFVAIAAGLVLLAPFGKASLLLMACVSPIFWLGTRLHNLEANASA